MRGKGYSNKMISNRKDSRKILKASPSTNDVVFGRGLRIQNHPGNIHYRKVIRAKALEYAFAQSRDERDNVVNTIMTLIPGRFLTLCDENYYELEQDVVMFKIKQACRDCKNKIMAAESRTNKCSYHTEQQNRAAAPKYCSGKKDINQVGHYQNKTRNDNTRLMNIKEAPPSPIAHGKQSPEVSESDMTKLLDICKGLSS